MSPPSLRIARKFQRAEGEIRVSANFNSAFFLLPSAFPPHRFPISLHDKPIGRSDARKRAVLLDFQHERIIQATRSLQHGSAAAAPAQDRDSFGSTSRSIYFGRHVVAIADHHEIVRRLP